ncbi:protein draper-like [Bolinopsis microptera]|uniref:protein draper-like n=1 Tax=Bolinopsis microptera TaxID=2820187 RepID=UPI00307A5B46
MSGLVVLFSDIAIRSGGTWEFKSFVSNTNAEGQDKEATLKIKYRILSCDNRFTGLGCNSCVDNYYGTECGKYCKPVSGHYTCHPTTGSKVCEGKRAGIECDDCVDHFEGNNCERCVQNYYPTESCNILCIPNSERYICTYEGEKQCLQYRTGSDCEDCVANHYGEDCSKTCHETSSFSCDESGEKECKENYYPAQKCNRHCELVPGNYTCNQVTGEKICLEGKEGEDCDECLNKNKEGGNCDKCIKNYYGDCTVYCKPDSEHYNCLENGTKICVDNTTVAEHDCRIPNHILNIPLIGAAGGCVGLFIILLLTCIILKVRKDRNKNVAEEILIGGETDNTQRNQYQEAIHPTVNNQAAHSSEETGDVYSRINRQEQGKQHPQIGPDQNQDALYSTMQSQPVYATIDKGDKYARLDRHEGKSNGTYSPETGEEPTYADVSFVRNERYGAVTFRNRAQNGDNGVEGTGQNGEEATYITVSQVIEERL